MRMSVITYINLHYPEFGHSSDSTLGKLQFIYPPIGGTLPLNRVHCCIRQCTQSLDKLENIIYNVLLTNLNHHHCSEEPILWQLKYLQKM